MDGHYHFETKPPTHPPIIFLKLLKALFELVLSLSCPCLSTVLSVLSLSDCLILLISLSCPCLILLFSFSCPCLVPLVFSPSCPYLVPVLPSPLAVLNAEWEARRIQQIPRLPRIHARDRGWRPSILSVKSVNLIMFIWKLTLAIFRVTKTYRLASRWK